MIEEKVLVQNFLNRKQRERLKKPDWLKIKLGDPRNQNAVLDLIYGLNLHTIRQEAKYPNIFECWTDKTRPSCSAATRARGIASSVPFCGHFSGFNISAHSNQLHLTRR